MGRVSRRPGVRGGPATRGFPPGSAQALVALVLGTIAGVNGLQQGQPVPGVLLLGIAALGGLQLVRLFRKRRRPVPGGK